MIRGEEGEMGMWVWGYEDQEEEGKGPGSCERRRSERKRKRRSMERRLLDNEQSKEARVLYLYRWMKKNR